MRLAWFTPWTPQRSGVAGRSAEVVPALARAGHGIDVCVDERVSTPERGLADGPPDAGQVRVQSAHDFVWRALAGQYDLVIYQLGNSKAHEFIWPYLFRWPGLAVLHEVRLHHARGAARLGARDIAGYRAEFAWNHPETSPDAAELGVAGFGGAYYYLWPMVRDVVESSRMVAVHSAGGAAALADAFPDRPVEPLTLGEGPDEPCADETRAATRAALGLPDSSVVFGVFGALTAEKRIAQILRAFRGCLAERPDARLLLSGAPGPGTDWQDVARAMGVGPAVIVAGVLDDAGFDRAIAAADVSLHLRWPTALETSGPWLRALAAGRPTVVTDLAHQAHVPTLDPRTWLPSPGGGSDDPIAIAVDILDEGHSLSLALRRLATDAALRMRLGSAGRRYWERTHSLGRMVEEYLDILGRAAGLAPPAVARRPPALMYDPSGHARDLVARFGDTSCAFF